MQEGSITRKMSGRQLSCVQGSPRSSSPPGDDSPSSSKNRVPSPSPTNKSRQGVNASLGLPSPREYRHKQRRQSEGEVMLMQAPLDHLSGLGGHTPSCAPLSVFECGNEVKELVAVGDKVWTAERRSANVSIRSSETGEIEKTLKPPTRNKDDNKKLDKEHIFPWSIIHVRFLKPRPPKSDEAASEDDDAMSRQPESPLYTNKSFVSAGGYSEPESRSTRKRAAPRRSSSSNRHAPPQKRSGESSTNHNTPSNPQRLSRDQYVDEVWVGYSNGCIRCFDAASGKYLSEMIEQGGIYCMKTWGEYVYAGSNDWTIRKWDAARRCLVGQFLPGDQGHSNSVRALTIADDMLVSGSDDFTIRLWDHCLVGQDSYSTTGRCLKVLHGHRAAVLTLTFANNRLWSGSEDATLIVWDLKGEKPQMIKQLTDTRHIVTKLVPLPDIHRVLCCSVDQVLRVYDARSLELVAELEGHTGFVHSCVAVATVLRYVVWSSSQDGTLRFWSIAGDDTPQSCSKFVTDNDAASELQRTRFRLRDTEAREAELQNQLSDMMDRNRRLQGDHDQSNSRLAALEADNERKDSEIAQLRKMLEEEKDRHSRSHGDTQGALSEMRAELDKKQKECDKLKRQLERLDADMSRNDMDQKRHYDGIVDDLKKQLEQLREDLRSAMADNTGEKRRQSELMQEKEDLVDEISRLRDELSRQRNDVEQHLRDQLDDALQALEEEKNLRRQSEDQYRGQLHDAKGLSKLEDDARDALKFERDLLSEELARRDAEDIEQREAHQRKAALVGYYESLAHICQNRADSAERKLALLGATQGRVIDVQSQLKVANMDLHKLRTQNERLMDENEAWQCTTEELKNQLRDALQKVRDLENQNEDLKEEVNLLLQDREGGKKRVTIAEDEARQARNNLRDEVANLEAKQRELMEDNEKLKSRVKRLDALEDEFASQQDELDALRNEVKDLIAELDKLRSYAENGASLGEELAALKAELDAVVAERDILRDADRNRGEEARTLRSDLANAKGRVARTEEVLNAMRAKKGALEDRVKELELELARLRDELEERGAAEERMRMEAEVAKMQGAARDHYQFIMQSRTDFIQAVYDWLLCSAMARRHMKRFDRNSAESVDTLQQAVEGAYKRGHYILSNYVSELEKHHLGVSPTLYPPDTILQQMFVSQRKECASFLKGDAARYNPAAITRVGILVDDNEVLRRVHGDPDKDKSGSNDTGEEPQDLSQRAASASHTSPSKGEAPRNAQTAVHSVTPQRTSPSPLSSTRTTMVSPLGSTRASVVSPLGSTRNAISPTKMRSVSKDRTSRSFTPPAAYRRANSNDGSRKGHARPVSPSTSFRKKSPTSSVRGFSSSMHAPPKKVRKDKDKDKDKERRDTDSRDTPKDSLKESTGSMFTSPTSPPLSLVSPASPVLPSETPNLQGSVTFRRNKLMSVIRDKDHPSYKEYSKH